MVTSSAVVGSSAMSSSGSHASAIAIMTRWAMPPDSSCGYARARDSGSGMPTLASISMTLSSSTSFDQSRWSLNTSRIWRPARCTGFRADPGCWKIIEMCSPRRRRTSSFFRAAMSSPLKRISPATISPGWPIRPMTDSDVTDLPQPDSPTSPRTSPRSIWSDTSSTALTTPSRVSKCVFNPWISSKCSRVICSAWGRGRRAGRHP